MDIEERDRDLIDRYLLGRATPDDLAEIDNRRETDAAFAANLAIEQAAFEAIHWEGDQQLKARLRAEEAHLHTAGAKIRSLPPRRTTSSNWWALVAGLVLLLALGMWWFFTAPRENEYLADYFEPYPNYAVELARSGNAATTYEQAYAAYEAGRFRDAITGFERILADTADAVTAFYLANARLATGDATTAATTFEELAVQPGFPLAPESRWYAALAQLAGGNENAARGHLREIASAIGAYKTEEAAALLRQLE